MSLAHVVLILHNNKITLQITGTSEGVNHHTVVLENRNKNHNDLCSAYTFCCACHHLQRPCMKHLTASSVLCETCLQAQYSLSCLTSNPALLQIATKSSFDALSGLSCDNPLVMSGDVVMSDIQQLNISCYYRVAQQKST